QFLIPPTLSTTLAAHLHLQNQRSVAMPSFDPDPKMKFTFGLWTVGNIGRDPFGEPTRPKLSGQQICDLLGEVGAYGVNFHDNDAIPIDATREQAQQIVKN